MLTEPPSLLCQVCGADTSQLPPYNGTNWSNVPDVNVPVEHVVGRDIARSPEVTPWTQVSK